MDKPIGQMSVWSCIGFATKLNAQHSQCSRRREAGGVVNG